jgi:hypothetical protein
MPRSMFFAGRRQKAPHSIPDCDAQQQVELPAPAVDGSSVAATGFVVLEALVTAALAGLLWDG